MKIIVVSTAPYPLGNATSRRVNYICKGLALSNCNVIIATPIAFNIFMDTNQNDEGIHNISQMFKRKIRAHGKVRAKLGEIKNYFILVKYIYSQKKDISAVLIIGPFLDLRVLVLLVCKLFQIPCYLEVNEFPFVGKENFINRWFRASVFWRLIAPLFHGYILITRRLEMVFRDKIKKNNKHYFVLPIIGEPPKMDALPNKNFIKPSRYIIHSGSLFESKDGFLTILKAFSLVQLEFSDLFLVVTGGHSQSALISHFISQSGLQDKIVFTGYLNDEELREWQQAASLAIVYKYDNLQNNYCFPTKLIDYIKFHVPIILTTVGAFSDYFIDSYNAILIPSNDIQLLSDKIKYLIENPNIGQRLANNAYKLIEGEFNYITQVAKLKKFFEYSSNYNCTE